ncbi:ATPases of the AAA+ class [Archaeoglobus sulfaticallidus PM70-1]|uniref:ATPases of the AAA+ class n=1 Tax=Archaeoglobus sulfaticallidus PM70-1 TaxID=387631 RepID=N0BMF5_9EURY|nr:ATP-binding protein [Archaeoglobus sulfaticallidus]AGK61811.1 ATPases of the AAA+ class [Archaeoglobus sulfaticallidus PM70-1]
MEETKVIELLLTAEVYNRYEELTEDDIPKEIRKIFYGKSGISRPLVVKMDTAKKVSKNIDSIKSLPFIDFNEFSKQFKITSFDLAIQWFAKRGLEQIKKNPVLAYYYQNYDSLGVSYEEAKRFNKPKYGDREWLKTIIAELEKNEQTAEMLGLVRIYSPEDIKIDFASIALTDEQIREFDKIEVALERRDYLKEIGVLEVGKLMFIGPPGTGKTTTARALSKRLHLPLVEVKLSMITSQYLGETSKNIEKVFEIAKRLSPCILFIDEFDYVAKTRTSDEHAAVKRAVNTLLKSIDEINLVEDGVILIAATNHPSLLDTAVWRRFDKIIEFPEPPEIIRRRIFELSLSRIKGEFDIDELVKLTDGFTGADIKLVIREAVLNSLMMNMEGLDQKLLVEAIGEVRERLNLKTSY